MGVPPWAGARTVLRSTGGRLRRNAVFATLCALGLGLRVLVMVAYQPAIFYIDTLGSYLNTLPRLDPTAEDPIGYDILLLRPVLSVGDFFAVAGVQHLLGLGMAVAIYALLTRKGVARWLAALATVPILLDAYQLQIEQSVMSETLFQTLLVAGFAVLAWPRHPRLWRAVVAGLLLGASATVRQVGEPMVLPALLYVLLAARGWRSRTLLAGATVVCFLLPVAGYVGYYHHWTGRYAMSGVAGSTLYGRVAPFVDCTGLALPDYERRLCPTVPRAQRWAPDYWAHNPASPASDMRDHPPPGRNGDKVLIDFSLRAIRHQPLDFARAVGGDALRVFAWQRTDGPVPGQPPVARWQFRTDVQQYPPLVTTASITQYSRKYGDGPPRVVTPLARVLIWYQRSGGYTPGPAVALAVLLALLAVAGVGRARRSPLRWVTAFYLAGGVVVLLAADLFEFSWRYQLPGYVLLPAAGALGATALLRRPAPPPTPEPATPEPVDEVAEAALAGFRERYGEPELPPVVVVIAAYNETATLGAVLDAVPKECLGQRVAPLVVTDGCTDSSAEVARARGVYTCEMSVNRGQGVALRLGYQLALAGGARYIVTTDADGQYDEGELPVLLAPLLAGEADFVVGSRRLGVDETTDPVRRAGTRFFALLVSVLGGQRVTDTSSGFRAMSAEVIVAVPQTQPQYQASELLMGALCHGFRVVERPMTMRRRGAGRSKKGNNFIYGLRYARVVVGTWWRERVRNSTRSSSTNLTRNIAA